MNKTCTKCEIEQDIEQFAYRNKIKEIRHCRCNTCQAEEKKKYYNENKEKEIAKAKISSKAARLRNAQYVYEFLLKRPCIKCTEKDPVVLEFDHREPHLKVDEISKLIYRAVSIEKLQIEIDKCDVLCANCHRRKTAIQNNYYSWRTE